MNGIEEIRKKVESEIKKNTEYAVFINGKLQKFAFYDLEENGRLRLLNTKHGTLTSMNASFFIKRISSKKYLAGTRPYDVEYPEGYQSKSPSLPKQMVIEDAIIDENI